MMPSGQSSPPEYLSTVFFYVPRKVHRALAREAHRRGVSISSLGRALILERWERREFPFVTERDKPHDR
jgi:hypothetical protein